MLALEQLSAGYRGKRGAVLGKLDCTLEPGSFVCILGRNGAGKSTLMRTIAGLQAPLEGRVLLGGESVASMRSAARARKIGVVLTERAFSPGLKVEDVVSLGRQPFTGWQGRLTLKDRAIAQDALSETGATPFKGRYFDDLSDGERQRVLIARAIAQSAPLMVLDEITAFLDLPGRVEIMAMLRRHAHKTGAIVLLSSHDLDLSLQMADTLWLIADASMRVGRPEELVAQDAIGAAFDTHEVAFVKERQRFELNTA